VTMGGQDEGAGAGPLCSGGGGVGRGQGSRQPPGWAPASLMVYSANQMVRQ